MLLLIKGEAHHNHVIVPIIGHGRKQQDKKET